MSYDKNKDYKALMDEAASRGDYKAAARYEQQRNEKIKSEGMSYKTSSDYAGWLDDRDYGEEIKSAVSSGSSKRRVAELLGGRMEKAGSTVGMDKYVKDDIYDMAVDYLSTSSKPSYTSYGGSYKSSYQSGVQKLLDKLEERQVFSYDYESDPLYQAYARAYQREGRRASEDALGMAAANTGGYASSYAVGAAQQAGSYYSAKQADKIPELYKLAYDVYKEDLEADLESLGLLSKLEEKDYQRYRDALEDVYRQDETDYKKYIAELERDRQREQLEYERGRDALDDLRYEMEWQYKRERDALKNGSR